MFLELSGFPLVLLAIIAFIVILGLIICLHEAGHFFMAKKFDVLCHDYSIGMGPAIYKKKGKETTFCVRAIPIGGFVLKDTHTMHLFLREQEAEDVQFVLEKK